MKILSPQNRTALVHTMPVEVTGLNLRKTEGGKVNKFVILSFVFLALGFYELSGGASFNPETTRVAMIDARQEREATRLAELPDLPPVAEIATPAETVVADAAATSEDETTRTPLNLVSFESASQPQPEAPQASTSLGPTDFVDEPEAEVTLESLQANVAQTQPIAFHVRKRAGWSMD